MNNGILGVVIPILTSLVAGVIWYFVIWLSNRKRESDSAANKYDSLTNRLDSLSDRMDNGFEKINVRMDRLNFEKDLLFYTFDEISTEHTGLSQKVNDILNHINNVSRPNVPPF